MQQELTPHIMSSRVAELVGLPTPQNDSGVSVENAIRERRSIREYGPRALTLPQIGQLLWAAQGITERTEYLRAAPSAGALYPLEIYVAAGDIDDLSVGMYHYLPQSHQLVLTGGDDRRSALSRAACQQWWMRLAPAMILISAVYKRTMGRYGQRAMRYVHMEAGHAAENILLQAVALGLATVVVGAFDDAAIQRIAGISEKPLYLMPVGYPPVE